MNNDFDALAAAKRMRQAGFSDRQADAVAAGLAESRSGMATKEDIRNMATKEDVAHCWQVMLGIIVPFLVLILGVLLTK
ncbi:MAG: hypothetical protein OXU98_00880 [Gammaproteobacteria bacterium]|nr:hypothetical protein [Gammaproteobacteria bacterium]